jgi:phosphoglycolate phosphatase-like HAD superfamily hydrolase
MFTETLRKGGGLVEYSVMVGDTCTDLLLARNAGVPCVLFNVPESIADWPPYDKVDIVDDFSEIPTVIEQWF